MIKEAIMKLSQKQDIGYEMAKAVMDEIMSGEASDVQKSAYLVGPVRKELGIRTIFNILGPLANPAGATMQVMGVYEAELVEPLARVLTNLGVKSAMVVYGMDKLDEISMSADTKVCEVRNGTYTNYMIKPEDFGFTRCTKEELVGKREKSDDFKRLTDWKNSNSNRSRRRRRTAPALSGYGHYPMGNGDHGEICTHG